MRTHTRIQSGRDRRQQLTCGLGLILTVFIVTRGEVLAAANTSPTIRLFPTTVVENIKHTGEAAKAMEADLQEVIDRLNQQEELYTASKCEGAEAEPGCSEIAGHGSTSAGYGGFRQGHRRQSGKTDSQGTRSQNDTKGTAKAACQNASETGRSPSLQTAVEKIKRKVQAILQSCGDEADSGFERLPGCGSG